MGALAAMPMNMWALGGRFSPAWWIELAETTTATVVHGDSLCTKTHAVVMNEREVGADFSSPSRPMPAFGTSSQSS